ncbi:MAG: hypothetical protein KF709_03425 [Gemmatimonadaceae bacterium]|nr:hypothetical protein [Gemmatimonadaceae bacterium]
MFVADAPPAAVTPVVEPEFATCNGETISRIDVYRYAPAARGLRAGERQATDPSARGRRLDNADTDVIRAYLRIREDAPCLEQNRADSERLIRRLPFVASAAITPVADGNGRVRIRVDVVNEFPLVVGGGLRGLKLDEIRLGTLDFQERGTTLIGSLQRGDAYRDGIGAHYGQPGFLGGPRDLTVSGAFAPLGGHARLTLVQPLLAEAQANAFLLQLSTAERYDNVYRNTAETAAARVQRSAYQFGVLQRIGRPGRGLIGIAGLAMLGSYTEADRNLVFVTDSGLQPVTDTTLDAHYGVFQSHHVAALVGLRALRFRRAGRFDALRAEQDIAQGAELTLVFGPGIGPDRDDLIASGLYLGAGTPRSFVSLQANFEGRIRQALGDGTWRFGVGHVHLTWFRLRSERRTSTLTLQGSVLEGHPLPSQLTMRDVEGGLLGYGESQRAGGQRIVARAEDRWLVTGSAARFDLAVGTFADVGQLWARDVPFGVDSPLMSSVGVSLYGAYPSGGRRVYRVDLGVPLSRGPGDRALVLRFSTFDRIIGRSREPRDVRTTRFETGPATAIRW